MKRNRKRSRQWSKKKRSKLNPNRAQTKSTKRKQDIQKRHRSSEATTKTKKREGGKPKKETTTTDQAHKLPTIRHNVQTGCSSPVKTGTSQQRRHSSIVSTDLDKWNNSDTVEVINLSRTHPNIALSQLSHQTRQKTS